MCQRALAGFLLLLGAAAPAPVHGQPQPDTLSVFFLGNSYTYYNNLPGMVEAISLALPGPVVRTASHTHGGFTLRGHLEDGHVPGVFLEPAEMSWDHVVLQEQSALGAMPLTVLAGGIADPGRFHDAVRELTGLVRGQGSELVLYMTWAKQRFPDQLPELVNAYEAIGLELGVSLAPVAKAWATVFDERPDIALYLMDGSHPSATGTFLAACVFYAELTGESPIGGPRELRGTPWNLRGPIESDRPTILVSLTEETATYLQEVAWEVVQSAAR